MSLSVGIVGLPNVGKSTLFNTLLKVRKANVANFPFCTIEPNTGIIDIKDKRLDDLAKISKSEKIVYPTIQFTDIAGIVKGANKGEGLGNKFLTHIKEVDLICHVVRNFKNDDIVHVNNNICPKDDISIINLELILKDLETVSNRIQKIEKKAITNPKEYKKEYEISLKLRDILEKEQLISDYNFLDDELSIVKSFHLLTAKKMIYVVNLDENSFANFSISQFKSECNLNDDSEIIPICIKFEEELIDLDENEIQDFLNSYNIKSSALDNLIQTSFQYLDLIYFFTSGEKESRGWVIPKGTNAKNASGVIHTDFIDKFVKVEVVRYKDFVNCGGWVNAKEKGRVLTEGKDYIVQDGDVVFFKI